SPGRHGAQLRRFSREGKAWRGAVVDGFATSSLGSFLPKSRMRMRYSACLWSVARIERSDIREQWRNLLGRSRISLTLNPGYKAGAHPGYETTEAKTYPPLFAALGQGSPSFVSSVSLDIEGDGAPTRRSARITPGGLSGLLRTMGRETSRPAPCGAPTRHLGLYAFDGGRTGPAR